MPRPNRILVENGYYHVFNRANNKRGVNLSHQTFDYFCYLLGDMKKIFNISIYSYCLMTNHYHIFLQTKLKNLDKMLKIKKRIARKYSNEINLDAKMEYNDSCSYHLYWICVKNRNKFMKKMLTAGIETGIHYKPIHQMSMYSKKQKLESTDKISKEIVSIPIHQNLSDNDTDRIIKTINEIC